MLCVPGGRAFTFSSHINTFPTGASRDTLYLRHTTNGEPPLLQLRSNQCARNESMRSVSTRARAAFGLHLHCSLHTNGTELALESALERSSLGASGWKFAMAMETTWFHFFESTGCTLFRTPVTRRLASDKEEGLARENTKA